jgi:hypothetical protein
MHYELPVVLSIVDQTGWLVAMQDDFSLMRLAMCHCFYLIQRY